MFDLKLNKSTPFKEVNLGRNRSSSSMFEEILLMEFNTDAQVLLLKHEIRYHLFTEFVPMDYADHIINAANSVSKKLKPYIAGHWRMETGKSTIMPICAKNLIRWFKNKQRKTGIKNLYLATDYPLLGKKSQSTTWHSITNFHTIAIQSLNSSLNLNTWVSMHPFDNLKNDKRLEGELKGAGIQGILDKLVLIQADYFVSCPKMCGRVLSKFTRKVREARTKEIMKKSSHLRNIWEVWYNV